jgi:hypothetical protein
VVFSDGLGSWTQRADTLYKNGGSLANTIPEPIDRTVVEIGFEIESAPTTFQHQIAIGTDSSSLPFYFVELNDNMGFHDVSVSDYDGTNYHQLDQQDPGVMHAGLGLIRLTTDGTPSFTVDAGWVGEMYHATAATPGFTPGVQPKVILNGLELELRYIAVIQRP